MKGLVFNIQHYSLHDGSGIRTVVFLKGCPLRCAWCCNPESQGGTPELSFDSGKCIGVKECGLCLGVCPSGAVKNDSGTIHIDRSECSNSFCCAGICPSRALTVIGRQMTIDDVLSDVESNLVFHESSGGGMTVSGGEPLFQEEFTISLLKEAKRRRIHTAIETCGDVEWSSLAGAAVYLDEVLYDIKSMNSEKHRQWTGEGNERILTNFRKLCAEFPSLKKTVRVPVIPGFNDDEEDILSIVSFANSISADLELLEYHRMGAVKYRNIGRDYALGDATLDPERFEMLRSLSHGSQ